MCLIVPTRRGSLVVSALSTGAAWWRAAGALAIPELAGCGARLRGRDPLSIDRQHRRADGQCDRGTQVNRLKIMISRLSRLVKIR
jgi:hypothetical protein